MGAGGDIHDNHLAHCPLGRSAYPLAGIFSTHRHDYPLTERLSHPDTHTITKPVSQQDVNSHHFSHRDIDSYPDPLTDCNNDADVHGNADPYPDCNAHSARRFQP